MIYDSFPKTVIRTIIVMRKRSGHINRFIILSLFLIITVNTYGEIDASRQKSILHLVKQDCGSCHGMTLKGGLGPSLTKERIVNLPDQYLFSVIKKGIPDSPMPPWQPFLSDEEIHWVIIQLRQGLSE